MQQIAQSFDRFDRLLDNAIKNLPQTVQSLDRFYKKQLRKNNFILF